jgi:hypothetical protein
VKIRSGIRGYFQHISNILALSPIISSQDIHTEKRTSTEGYLRGNITFKNGSRLHFRELVSTEPTVQLVSYTYQYMGADGKTIFRYDDSDHYLHLSNAPHHKHVGKRKVIAVDAPDLESVLSEIEKKLFTDK